MKTEAQKVIAALEKGEYTVSYEAPNCFSEHTKPDGDKFYVIVGDDARFGCDYGSTTVSCLGHDFTWNSVDGCWDGVDEIEYEEDESECDVVDALDGLDVSRISDCPDTDELISFYEIATGEKNVEAYYYEDPDIPESID